MCRILYEIKQTNTLVMKMNPSPLPPLPIFTHNNTLNDETEPASSTFNNTSPILLLVIITLALIFFISGLLHLLVRFLMKRRTFPSLYDNNRFPETSGSNYPLQRQLQQLFRLHDSGLDQAFIEALPVFYYKDIMGLKEPFDCAVCLCEFSDLDKLRLLPSCSHAFHIQCIDTWLLSNSTCPLCRGTLLSSRPPLENSSSNSQVSRQTEERVSSNVVMEGIGGERRVFSVRLGKFRSLMCRVENSGKEGQELEETSCANLDGRRCYSMGTFQYVVGESNLQVALSNEIMRENGSLTVEGDVDGKRIKAWCRRGESFSISKVWLWSKKSKIPTSYSSNFLDASAASITAIRSPVHDRSETTVDV